MCFSMVSDNSLTHIQNQTLTIAGDIYLYIYLFIYKFQLLNFEHFFDES